jgi:hypothetical protein
MATIDMIKSFLHPEEGYKKAGQDVSNSFEQFQNFLRPYQNTGLNQIGTLEGAKNELLNPETLLNKWISGYQESPYAKQTFENAKNSALDSASQMGLLGSSSALHNIETSAGNIVNADRQQYLQDLMNKYLQGVGISQNLFGTGANAGGQLGTGALSTGENLASTSLNAANAPGQLLQNLIGLGVGAYTGGLPAAAAVSGLMRGGSGGGNAYNGSFSRGAA